MVGRLARVVKRWPAVTAMVVVILAGIVAWGYDQRSTNQRIRERQRDITTVCMFINDTRAELRYTITELSNSTLALPPGSLPQSVLDALAASRADSTQRRLAVLNRLMDYDCDAFLRGQVPNRGPGDPPQR